MDKIKWCLNVKNGIEIVEPDDDLAVAYIKKGESALNASAVLKNNKEWEIASTYYAIYFSLYAILMKIGIKCEIHSCTISFMEHFLKDYFSAEDVYLIKKSMRARIDVQYYSDRQISDELYKKMTTEAPLFLAKCKQVLNELNEETINIIRDKIKDYQI